MSATEPCPACGEAVDATITMMMAHWTLECDEADDYTDTGREVAKGDSE